MMLDGERIVHASGHHMLVVVEPLVDTVARIAAQRRRWRHRRCRRPRGCIPRSAADTPYMAHCWLTRVVVHPHETRGDVLLGAFGHRPEVGAHQAAVVVVDRKPHAALLDAERDATRLPGAVGSAPENRL